MKNIDYVYRQKGGHVLTSKDEKINILKLLETDYPYIYNLINESTFNIRLNECDQFKELIYNEKVVGFVTYDIINKSQKLLTNIYVIGGYRRNRIFTKELTYQFTNLQIISIFEPTKLLVETLIRMGYAIKITESLVISAINFKMQLSTSLSNNDDELPHKLKVTNMYDTHICATLSLKIFNKTRYTVYYTRIQEEDKNKCKNARNEMNNHYFDNIVTAIIGQDAEIQRWLYLLRHNLPSKQVNLEELIGTNESPSKILIDNIENNNITKKEARNIQNQLRLESRTNKVGGESLELRLQYLINNINTISTKKSNKKGQCPYCHEDKPELEHYCTICGYKLFDLDEMDEEEFVYKQIFEEKQSYKHSLTGIKEHKYYQTTEYLTNLAIIEIIYQTKKYIQSHDIFSEQARENDIPHINLEKLMIEKGYVTFNMNSKKWDTEANSYTNKELKAILKEHGCKISGNKYELIQRIKNEVPLEKIQSNILEVTKKGEQFYKDNMILYFFEDNLYGYIYEEFEEFINKDSENILEDSLNFLQKHVEMAIKTENHDQMVDSLRAQAQIYSYTSEVSKILENEVKIVILNLNMYYINPHYYQYYKPVDKISWEILYSLKEYFTNEEVNDAINKVIQSLDEKQIKVRTYDMIEVFKDIFKHYSLTGINGRIQQKYYKKKEYKTIRKKGKSNFSNNITTLDRFL